MNDTQNVSEEMLQQNLPGMADGPVLAEQIFTVLAQRWKDGILRLDSPRTQVPRVLDETALACVLLSHEQGRSFSSAATSIGDANILLARERSVPWMDELPWFLCRAGMQDAPAWSGGVESVSEGLNHHSSSIRIWMMELAWMIRSWLKPEPTAEKLLENVAGTLCGVSMAWGLAASLFPDEAEFIELANGWVPERFQDQYAERRKALIADGSLASQSPFWRMEANCRKLIAETAFQLLGNWR